ncbi:MAG: discoidin domain-containing protein [Longicatena sp.]|nr:discoidin domain-containing protein [Longicatena sp.]
MRKIMTWFLSIAMMLSLVSMPTKIHAGSTVTECVNELISYFKSYQLDAETDIERVLAQLEKIDATEAKAWKDIMHYWLEINQPNYVVDYTEEELQNGIEIPDGVPNDNSVAIIVLGYALNSDGTMTNELVGRLKVAKALADQLPNSYILVTGGVQKNGWTECMRMTDWLVEAGIPLERIIQENAASSTVSNATKSYSKLVNDYPQVNKLIMVTSDYHIQRGSILFRTHFTLKAKEAGVEPMPILFHAGYETGKSNEGVSSQASAVTSVSGYSSGTSVTLSILNSLHIALNTPYETGSELDLKVIAGYNTGYQSDVTDKVVIEGFDPQKDASQLISVSYTENDVCLAGTFVLSNEEKVLSAYDGQLSTYIEEAKSLPMVLYTTASQEVISYALNYAHEVMTKTYATDEEKLQASTALRLAIDNAQYIENIALNKTVSASHNQSAAQRITNGSTSDYWTSLNADGGNEPIENSSFVIDLKGIYNVDAVNAIPYFASNNRYYQYDVLLSEDNEDWECVAQYRGTDITTSKGQLFVLDTAKRARYIKIQGVYVYVSGRTDIDNFHMTEVLAYGSLVEALPSEPEAIDLVNVAQHAEVLLDSGTSPYLVTNNTISSDSYSTSGNGVENATATIILPALSDVKSVTVITPFSDSSIWYNYEVLISEDNTTWESIGKNELSTNAGEAGFTITLDQMKQARYVQIKGLLSNDTQLKLVEVLVSGSYSNILLGKTTIGSHHRSTSSKYQAYNIVDGDPSNTNYWDTGDVATDGWANTTAENRPYAIIQLDALHLLNSISVLTYRNSTRHYKYEVYSSIDGEAYTLIGAKTDNTNAAMYRTFYFDEPITAKFIKVVGTHNSSNKGFHLSEVQADGTLCDEADADYSAVDAAIAKVNVDSSIYTADSYVSYQLVKNTVVRGLKASSQAVVDEYALALEEVIAKLTYRDADYNEVEKAITLANEIKDLVKDFTDLQNAIDAVDYDKNILAQAEVDAMAKAINDAIAMLQYKDADYTKVEEAIVSANAIKSLVKDFTVLQNAMDDVEYGLDIRNQAEVDAYADAILAAMAQVEYKPTHVENVKAESINYKTIQLTWDEFYEAQYYIVERLTSEGKWIELATTTEHSYVASGVKTGKEYTYRVKAILADSESKYSQEVKVTTALTGEVELTMSPNGTNKFDLSWTSVEGATRYIIYRKDGENAWKKVLTLGKDATSYTSKDMKANTYQYQVKAARYDSVDRVMTNGSNVVEGIVGVETMVPTNITTQVNGTSITLAWDKIVGMSHYEIYRSKDEGVYRQIKRTTDLTITSSGLKLGSTYQYKIKAFALVNGEKVYAPEVETAPITIK